MSKNKIPLVKLLKKLVELVGDVNDQGFVAELKEFKSLEFNEWLSTLDKEQNPLVFVLDELEDPHNVGAVVRGGRIRLGVILSKHRQAPINATVFKTSAGTVAKLPIVVVSNTNDTIKKLKDEKFWVVGLDSDAQKAFGTKPMIIRLLLLLEMREEALEKRQERLVTTFTYSDGAGS